jgi:hypothetical protein
VLSLALQVFHLSDANDSSSTVWTIRITVQQMSFPPFFHVYTLLISSYKLPKKWGIDTD